MGNFLKKYQAPIGFFVLFFVTFFLFSRFGFLEHTDDGWFKEKTSNMSVFHYIRERYFTWSPRIVPEISLYYIFKMPLLVFQFINTCFYFLFVYSIGRIFSEKVRFPVFILAYITILYSSYTVIFPAVFWMTGAVNYLWPAALGLFTFTSFYDYFYRDKKKITPWQIVAGILFAFSNEQLILCAIGVCVVYFLSLILQKRKLLWSHAVLTLIFIGGLLTMYVSPGNELRVVQETAVWMPEFKNMTVMQHIKQGVSWLYSGWNDYFILLFLFIFLFTALLYKGKYSKLFLSTGVGLFGVWGLLFKVGLLEKMKNSIWLKEHASATIIRGLTIYFPFLLWGILIGSTILFSIWVIKKRVFLTFLYLATFLSSMLLWLSPTMYASGPRVFFASNVLLLLILIVVVKQWLSLNQEKVPAFIFGYSLFPLLNIVTKILS